VIKVVIKNDRPRACPTDPQFAAAISLMKPESPRTASLRSAIMNGKGIPTAMFPRAALILLTVSVLDAQVTFDRILHADKEPQNWLTYSGTTLGQRYSTLNQITPDNVKDLTMQWAFQARSTEKF